MQRRRHRDGREWRRRRPSGCRGFSPASARRAALFLAWFFLFGLGKADVWMNGYAWRWKRFDLFFLKFSKPFSGRGVAMGKGADFPAAVHSYGESKHVQHHPAGRPLSTRRPGRAGPGGPHRRRRRRAVSPSRPGHDVLQPDRERSGIFAPALSELRVRRRARDEPGRTAGRHQRRQSPLQGRQAGHPAGT
ncbi:hypothetical protein D3C72_1787520 [compost metagenome]